MVFEGFWCPNATQTPCWLRLLSIAHLLSGGFTIFYCSPSLFMGLSTQSALIQSGWTRDARLKRISRLVDLLYSIAHLLSSWAWAHRVHWSSLAGHGTPGWRGSLDWWIYYILLLTFSLHGPEHTECADPVWLDTGRQAEEDLQAGGFTIFYCSPSLFMGLSTQSALIQSGWTRDARLKRISRLVDLLYSIAHLLSSWAWAHRVRWSSLAGHGTPGWRESPGWWIYYILLLTFSLHGPEHTECTDPVWLDTGRQAEEDLQAGGFTIFYCSPSLFMGLSTQSALIQSGWTRDARLKRISRLVDLLYSIAHLLSSWAWAHRVRWSSLAGHGTPGWRGSPGWWIYYILLLTFSLHGPEHTERADPVWLDTGRQAEEDLQAGGFTIFYCSPSLFMGLSTQSALIQSGWTRDARLKRISRLVDLLYSIAHLLSSWAWAHRVRWSSLAGHGTPGWRGSPGWWGRWCGSQGSSRYRSETGRVPGSTGMPTAAAIAEQRKIISNHLICGKSFHTEEQGLCLTFGG